MQKAAQNHRCLASDALQFAQEIFPTIHNNFDQKCIAFSSKKHHSLKWDTLQFPPIYPSQRHNWPSSLEIIIFQNLEIFKIINISKKKTKISIFPENFQTHRGTTTEIKEPAASFPMNSKIFNHFQRTYKGRYTI